MSELEKILQRAASGALPPEDVEKLRALLESYQWLQGEIGRKDASLGRLRKLLFGTPRTEKTNELFGEKPKKVTEDGRRGRGASTTPLTQRP